MLDPEFFSDPDLVANFDITGRVFYAGLWCVAEDSWVFEPNMLGLKMKIFPGDNIDPAVLAAYYGKFVSMGRIIEFEVRGRKYAWLKNCPKRQKVDHPSAPSLPLPSWVEWHGEGSVDDQGVALKRHQWYYKILEDVLNDFVSVPDKSPTSPEQVPDESPLIEVKLIEVKLSELNNDGPSPAAPPSPPKPPKVRYTDEEKSFVEQLKGDLRAKGISVAERDWHLKQLAIVHKLLADYDSDELRSCYEDAKTDPYWYQRLDSWAAIVHYLPKWKLKTSSPPPSRAPDKRIPRAFQSLIDYAKEDDST
jgi:hypothetical protein